MRVPAWLDRVWLCLIAASFLVMAPLWVAIWYERNPWYGLSQGIVVGIVTWHKLLQPMRDAFTDTPHRPDRRR